VSAIDVDRVASAVSDLLTALGCNLQSEALADTPRRVARAWIEQLDGMHHVADEVLDTTFPAERYDEVIVLREIPFYSTCEHHLLPFHGSADVAYIPGDGRVVGLSKLARLVELHARRLQLQERLTRSVADDLERVLKPRGVAVIVRAQHLCMQARGIMKPGAAMVTSVMRGAFRESAEARAEVIALVQR
jgi:GTP cyclohydrolase I